MRFSNFLCVLAMYTTLVSVNVFSITVDSDNTQIISSVSYGAMCSREAVQDGNSKTFLRTLKALNVDNKKRGDDVEEERSTVFGAINKLFQGSTARKAARAAKAEAAKAAKAAKAAEMAQAKERMRVWYGKLLERDDFLYDAMEVWRTQRKSAGKIYDQMIAVGRTSDEAALIHSRFNVYRDEMMKAGK